MSINEHVQYTKMKLKTFNNIFTRSSDVQFILPDVLGCIQVNESVLNIQISPNVSVSFQPPCTTILRPTTSDAWKNL